MGNISRDACGLGSLLLRAQAPSQGCVPCPWTCLVSHMSADLVQSVREKGSVRQNLSLETPECLSCVTPTPPHAPHTHEESKDSAEAKTKVKVRILEG